MAELTTIARPYAEAAFAVAREGNALPVWSEALRLAAAVAQEPRMAATMGSPKLTAAQKESLFLSVCGEKLGPGARNFVRVVVEAGRVPVLPEISRMFDALKDDAEGVARAMVTSAFPLGETQLAEIKGALEHKLGRTIDATLKVDPALIGGAIVQVGDTVIDGSVRGKLAAMATQLRT